MGWVSFLHTPPEVQPEGVALILEGGLVGVGSLERIVVKYRRMGEEGWQETLVMPAHGDLHRAVIPPAKVRPPGVEYHLVLRDSSGEERPVFRSPDNPRRVRVDGLARASAPASTEEPGERVVDATSEMPVDPRPMEDNGSRPVVSSRRLLSGERVAVSGPEEKSVTRAPAIVSVVSRHQMSAMGARTLSDVLKSVPGLETSRDVQGFHQVAVRGLQSDPEVLLLYDGRRLDSLYDARKLYEMPVEHVERVEVLRGLGATLHGTGAFLAVINVVPRLHQGLSFAASGDTNALGSLHIAFGRSLPSGHVQVEGDLDVGRGYRAPIITDAFDRDTRAAAGVTDDSRVLLHGGSTLGIQVGDGHLDLSLRGFHQDRGALVGAFDSVGAGSSLTWSMLLAGARYETILGRLGLSSGIEADLHMVERRFQLTPLEFHSTDGFMFPNGVIEEISHGSGGVGLDVLGRAELFQNSFLSFGFLASWQHLRNFRYAVNVDPSSGQPLDQPEPPENFVFPARDTGLTRRLSLSLFAMNDWLVHETLELTVGFRGDVFLGGVGREDPASPVGERGSEYALSPRLGMVWSPFDGWTLKALHASGFRVPTFEELTSRVVESSVTRGRFEGNSTLSPVRIRTSEVGLERALRLADRDVLLRTNVFLNQFLGRIEAVDLTGNVTPLYNRDGAIVVLGAEGEGRMTFSDRDWLSFGMAWFRGVDSQAPAGRNLLTTVPQQRLILRAQLGLGSHLDLHVGAVFGSERRNNARSSLEALRRYRIPPYALVDATIQTRPIAEKLSLALTVNNLLDNPYHDDVPRPDRMTGLLPGQGLSGRLMMRLSW